MSSLGALLGEVSREAQTGDGPVGRVLATDPQPPAPVPEPGRANVIDCPRYLPGSQRSCSWAADPRSAGLALGSN